MNQVSGFRFQVSALASRQVHPGRPDGEGNPRPSLLPAPLPRRSLHSKPGRSLTPDTRHLTSGFTLIELMVSIAILLAVMAMVGLIFNTAGKSSSLAQANSSVYRQLRTAASQLRIDLDGCQPGSGNDSPSALAIAGVEVAAFRTQKDSEGHASPIDPNNPPANTTDAYADIHRADVLMFTTDRDIQPYVFQQPATPIKLDPISLVTYGHADISELVPSATPGKYAFNLTKTKRIEGTALIPKGPAGGPWPQSDRELPASTWHLTRRVLRFPANAVSTGTSNVWPQDVLKPFVLSDPTTYPSATPTDDKFLTGEDDLYQYSFANTSDTLNVTPPLRPCFCMLDLFGQGYLLYDSINSANNFFAIRGSRPGSTWLYRYENGGLYVFSNDHWYASGGGAPCGTDLSWVRKEQGISPDPTTCAPDPIASPPNGLGLQTFDRRTAFYSTNPSGNRRTILDPNAPAQAAEHMGSYFLPNCSDFLVEYTYDDPAEVLVTRDDASGNWHAEPQAPIRWQRVPNGQQMVWSRLSVNPKNYSDPSDPRNRTDPIRWPRALRITIRAWGPGNTLENPIDQVIVHTFQ